VIVAALDVVRVPANEATTDRPLIVDRDRALALPIIPERVQPIAWRYLEVVQLGREVDVFEFAESSGSEIDRDSLRCAGGEELFRPAVSEGLDHREL